MTKNISSKKKAGTRKVNEPRLLKEILAKYFVSDKPLAVAALDGLLDGLCPNTELCVDLKLLTRHPGRLPKDKMIGGGIMRDGDDHYVFVEIGLGKKVAAAVQRNPVVFAGGCVNVHRLADGTLRPSFNRPRYYEDFSFRDFCLAAAQELIIIGCLVGVDDSDLMGRERMRQILKEALHRLDREEADWRPFGTEW